MAKSPYFNSPLFGGIKILKPNYANVVTVAENVTIISLACIKKGAMQSTAPYDYIYFLLNKYLATMAKVPITSIAVVPSNANITSSLTLKLLIVIPFSIIIKKTANR